MESSDSTGMVGISTGSDTGSGTRSDTGIITGSGTGSGSGSGTRSDTGMLRSGRTAPSGGVPRALQLSLCLVLPLTLLLLPTPVRALPTPGRALPTPDRALPTPQHSLAEGLNRSRDLLEAARASLHRLKELDILGFECTLEEVDLEDITEDQINTIKACTSEDPGAGNCPALGRSSFDKRKCLQGIYEDLSAYRAELGNFSAHQVLAPLEEMMRVLESSRNTTEPPGAGTGGAAGAGTGGAGAAETERTGAGAAGTGTGTEGAGAAETERTGAGAGTEAGAAGGGGGAGAAGEGAGAAGSGPLSFQQRLRLCSVLQALRIRSVTISRMMNFLSSLESSL